MKQGAIAFFMAFFDICDHVKFLGKLGKAFLFSGNGKSFIHIRPFIMLTLGTCF